MSTGYFQYLSEIFYSYHKPQEDLRPHPEQQGPHPHYNGHMLIQKNERHNIIISSRLCMNWGNLGKPFMEFFCIHAEIGQ